MSDGHAASSAGFDGRAEDHDLGRALHDHRRGEVHADHRVRPHPFRIGDHPLERLLARLRLKLGVFLDFAADDVLQRGQNVVPDVPCAHGAPAGDAQDLDDLLVRDGVGGGEKHMGMLNGEG